MIGYATGVLLDNDGKMWFANPPSAFGRYLFGKAGQAAMTTHDGKRIKAGEEICIVQVFDNVVFDFDGIDYGDSDEE